MKKLILSFILAFSCLFLSVPQSAFAYNPKPAAFVVIDQSGNLTAETYKSWASIVKLIYHIPQHELKTTKAIEEKVAVALLTKKVKVDKAFMQRLAEETNQDVLVIANIKAMDVIHVLNNRLWDNDEDYYRVMAIANLYVYHKETDKFNKKELWENDVKPAGAFDQPEYTIKWAISKMVNQNEGKPVIQ